MGDQKDPDTKKAEESSITQPTDIFERIKETVDLPTIPTTLTRILEVTNSVDSDVSDLVEVVITDQALAAKILRVANSALYGLPRKVDDLERAIALLGFYQVRDLALSMSIFDSLYIPTPAGAMFNRAKFWDHCFIVAFATRELAKGTGSTGGNAFTAGLLHDVGKVLLDMKIPKLFGKIVEQVVNTKQDFITTEHALIGCGHDRLGAFMLDRWNLPQDLVLCAQGHHEPAKTKNPMADLTYCANRLANINGFGCMYNLPESSFVDFLNDDQTVALQEAGRLPEPELLAEVDQRLKDEHTDLEDQAAALF
jgi:putative nucleotidyltransferase with HDIG domain